VTFLVIVLSLVVISGCEEDKTPVNPDAGEQVLIVVNQGDGSIMEFNANTYELMDSVGSGVNKPHHIEFSRDGEYAYVVNRDAGGKIAKFILSTLEFVDTATGGANVLPTSIAISADGLTGWTTDFTGAGNGRLHKYNLTTMEWVDSSVATGRGTHDIKITTDGNTLVACNDASDGITVYTVNTGNVEQININDANPFTGVRHYGPYGIAIDNADSLVYIACRFSNDVRIMNLATRTMLDSIAVPPSGLGGEPGGPCLLRLSPDGSKLYVTTQRDNQLIVISTATKQIIKTITFSTPESFGVYTNDDGTRVYVACVNNANQNGRIYIINGTNDTVLDSITVGKNPYMVHFHDHEGHGHAQ
jgi:YVTN family beta-propeller protein